LLHPRRIECIISSDKLSRRWGKSQHTISIVIIATMVLTVNTINRRHSKAIVASCRSLKTRTLRSFNPFPSPF
jgi:hypothetical protein